MFIFISTHKWPFKLSFLNYILIQMLLIGKKQTEFALIVQREHPERE